MSALELFSNGDHEIRAILTKDGEPWFVAADICAALGLGNPSQTVSYLDDDERAVMPATLISDEGGPGGVNVVNEAGLYSMILRSRKPEAKVFKRWITHEVLPSIRKTGAYSVPSIPAQRDVSTLDRRALALMVIEAEDAREAAEAKVAELEPRAEIADAFLGSVGDYSVREAAQILTRDHGIDIGQARLFGRLHALGWLDPTGRPYQRHIDCGRLRSKPQTYSHPRDGSRQLAKPQVRITPKGVADLYRLLSPGAGLATLTPSGDDPYLTGMEP